jgi:predicted permease
MPDWKRLVRERLELPELEGRGEERIYDEMADHLEQLYQDAIALGDSDTEAVAHAIEHLGEARATAEELVSSGRYRVRSSIEIAQDELEVSLGKRGGIWLLLSDLMRDLRHGLRSLRRSPGFVMVALVTCALGIGSSTAIFSVLNSVLFEPFPFPEPDRLVTIWTPQIGYEGVPMSAPDYHDFRRSSQVFSAWGVYSEGRVNLTDGDTPERLTAFRCSPGLLQALGVKPALGRLFTAADEHDGDSRLVVMSDQLWKRRFAADPELVGTTILLNSEPYSVVGVLPPEFRFPAWLRLDNADLYPLLVVPDDEASRGNQYLLGIGRLKEDATIEQADQELNIIASRLAKEYPESNHRRIASIVPLRDIVLGDSGRWLWMLMAAVGFVLLIACSNVAGLLLARGTARSGELAIRSALGAGRGRIIRQLLVEGCLLSTLGGIAGLALAWWGVGILRGLIPTALPRVAEMRVDGMVLLFSLGISLATGILFGLAPALETFRVDLSQAIRASRRTSAVGRRKSHYLAALVVVQFALALVLVNGAAAMLKSLWNVTGARELYQPEKVLIAGLSLDGPRYQEKTVRDSFMELLFDRLRGLPGVEAVGASTRLPLTSGWAGGVLVEGEDYDAETERPLTWFVGAGGNYFEAMGIRVVQGRALRPGDGQGEIPSAVANVVVNQSFAERYWPGEDPLGKQVRGNFEPPWFVGTVVGVVEDVRQNGLESGVDRELYLPFLPGFMPDRWIVIRATGEPTDLTSSVRHELAAIDPELPLSSVLTGDGLYHSSAGGRRFSTLLFGLFAVVALYLIGAGAYGALAFDVVRRKHEIGIRGALGASTDSIVKLVLSRGLRLALAGVGLGLAGAVVSSQLLRNLLFQVGPLSPISLGLAVGFLVLVALLASVVPALRAAAVDPVQTLQSE